MVHLKRRAVCAKWMARPKAVWIGAPLPESRLRVNWSMDLLWLKPSYNYLYGPSEIVSAHCDRNMYFWKQKGLVTKFDTTNVLHDKCFVNFNEHDIGL